MRRIRVLELIKSLDVGGAEMLLLERLRIADRDRFDYSVAFLDDTRTDLVPAFEEIGIPLRCLGAQSVADWRWLLHLRRHLRDQEVDVAHVHSPLMAAGVRAVVRSLGRSRPALITTEHSVTHHNLTLLLDIATVRADDLVIAVSEAVRASPVCRAARKVETVHHGVSVEHLRDFRSNREQLARDLGLVVGPRVVSVANFRPEKGYAVLLQAARLVHEEVPSVHFYVAGQGPLEESIRSDSLRARMGDYFHVLGRVPTAARLSACADVFVLCSSWEGRPVALMEALAAGVPAVVTAVGGMPDLVRDGVNGRLVPPDDPWAVAAALVTVLHDVTLCERLSDGALESGSDYDIARACNIIESHYQRLVAARKNGLGG